MDQVEQVKQKTDIVGLVSEYVILKKAGRNFKGLCPFHGEKSPSFMVSPELGIYKCFGCQKGGDAFGFLQEVEGIDFGEALKILAEKAGIKLETRNLPKNDDKTEIVRVQELATEYYHYLLTQHNVGKDALKYLQNRGINDKLIKQFRIGFALSSWDGLVKFLVGKKKVESKWLLKAGLVVNGSKGDYDRFRGRVMFPLLDARGKVIAFAGRILPGLEEQDSAKYINSPETEVYHKSKTLYGFYQAKQAIRKADRVVVVEGELDMISSFAAGVSETVAIKGSALTQEQIDILARLTNNFILALDADAAGQLAMKRGIELAEKKGVNIKIVRINGGKDPDDIARENAKEWKRMLDKAMDVYEFYIQAGSQDLDLASVEGKRQFSAEVFPVIAKIENKIIKSFYTKRIASLLNVSEESVGDEIERVGKMSEGGWVAPKVVEEAKEEGSRQERLESELLTLVFAATKELSPVWTKQLLKDRMVGSIGRVLEEWWQADGKLKVVDFIHGLPSELQDVAQIAYLREVSFDRIDRDFAETLNEWHKIVARQRLKDLGQEVKRLEEAENLDQERMSELQKEFMEWTKRLRLANN